MHNRRRQQCGGRGCGRRMGQFLDPVLLLLLKQAPAHGYTLLARLSEFGMDFLAPTVVYRALREMEAQGWVTSLWDEEETQGPPRRVYAITPAGEDVLCCCEAQFRETQQVIEYFLALHSEIAPERMSACAGNPTSTIEEVTMRIVIPAAGTDLDAPAASVFGRCENFIFVDPETLDFESLPNPALSAPGGAGVQAAQTVLQRGAGAIVAPSLGPNAFRVIDAAGIPAYRLEGATVRDVVTAFREGRLERIAVPGADHAGLKGRTGR